MEIIYILNFSQENALLREIHCVELLIRPRCLSCVGYLKRPLTSITLYLSTKVRHSKPRKYHKLEWWNQIIKRHKIAF